MSSSSSSIRRRKLYTFSFDWLPAFQQQGTQYGPAMRPNGHLIDNSGRCLILVTYRPAEACGSLVWVARARWRKVGLTIQSKKWAGTIRQTNKCVEMILVTIWQNVSILSTDRDEKLGDIPHESTRLTRRANDRHAHSMANALCL